MWSLLSGTASRRGGDPGESRSRRLSWVAQVVHGEQQGEPGALPLGASVPAIATPHPAARVMAERLGGDGVEMVGFESPLLWLGYLPAQTTHGPRSHRRCVPGPVRRAGELQAGVDEGREPNLSLDAKLKQDFNARLPEIPAEDEGARGYPGGRDRAVASAAVARELPKVPPQAPARPYGSGGTRAVHRHPPQ